MGLRRRHCGIDNSDAPDPGNFVIEAVVECGTAVAAAVHYPGCNNFEGRKILVYENMTEQKLRRASWLDPHFRRNEFSPVARFRPDADGWVNACGLASIVGMPRRTA